MMIQVSGKKTEVENGITVIQLMEQQKVETPQYVTVAAKTHSFRWIATSAFL